jgi:NTP pyrophosphatase (non-canonical NTP hydrolase)
MDKFARAVKAAEQLPQDMREEIGERLLHYIDKFLALQADIDIGLAQLDRGEAIPGDVVFSRLRARFQDRDEEG